jgi:hypothetical protein
MENDKIRFLVNSKTFRKYLKEIIEAYPEYDEFDFTIVKGLMIVGGFDLPITTKHEGIMTISRQSVINSSKALKHASEQPIVVNYEETWNCFNINCCF